MSDDAKVVPNRVQIIDLCETVIHNAASEGYSPKAAVAELQRAMWLAREDAGDYACFGYPGIGKEDGPLPL